MKPTKEGKRFLLATLLIAVAAANTGNNLIYLILAMMLSIILISIAALNINLRDLSFNFFVAQPVFAGSRSKANALLINNKRLIPSYSVHIEFPEGIYGNCAIPYVKASSGDSVDTSVIFKKRGIYSYKDFFLESSFPFILFNKRTSLSAPGELIVYPEIKEIDELNMDISGADYGSHLTRYGYGNEFIMIREFRYGDNMRRIQWKASAKTGKLMVRETGMDEPKLFTIVLDNIKPLDEKSFEKAVSFAASLSYKFILSGFFVRLLTCKKIIPFGTGQEHLFKILDVLALVAEDDVWECPMMQEMQGTGALILKTRESNLKKLEPLFGMVIYASDL